MNYTLLKTLMNLMEEFHQESSSHKIEDFVVWLNQELFSVRGKDEHTAHGELLIAFKLMYLNKGLKKQTKSVLSQSNVSSIDEYSFLLHLAYQESFRKMEIIDLHNLEPPTGIEVIKRLLKNGLIEEFADTEDRRAKRIKITEKGTEEVNRIRPQIDSVFTQFTKPLEIDDKIRLSGMLDKLIGPTN